MALTDYKFTSDSFHKKYFGEGIYPIIIMDANYGETKGGSEYIEFVFRGEGGESQESARMWMTPKSADYTAQNIRSIVVHNAPEDKKDSVREAFDEKVVDGQILFECALGLAANGAKAWIKREKQEEPYGARLDNEEKIYAYRDGADAVSDAIAHGATPLFGYDVRFYGYNPDKTREEVPSDAKKATELIVGKTEDFNGKTPF